MQLVDDVLLGLLVVDLQVKPLEDHRVVWRGGAGGGGRGAVGWGSKFCSWFDERKRSRSASARRTSKLQWHKFM